MKIIAEANDYLEDLCDDPLWSARMLVDNLDGIREIHDSYLNAGADAITACTYQASVDGFMKYLTCSADEAQSYLRTGATICKEACDKFTRKLKSEPDHPQSGFEFRSCAALGPYGVYLSDGSEYNGHYVDTVSTNELKQWHERRLSVLAREELDYYMFVTMPALGEVEAILPLVREYPNLKFTVTFSCKDGSSLNHGESIIDAVHLINKYDSVVAVGVNCTSPLYMSPLIEKISPRTSKEVLILPNSGETWSEKSWHGNSDVRELESYVPEWIDKGATWIGSCCRTTPEDTTKLRREAYKKLNSSF